LSQNRLPRLAAGINRKSLGAETVIRKGNGPALVLSVIETLVLDCCDARKDRAELAAQIGAQELDAALAKLSGQGFLAPEMMPQRVETLFTEIDGEGLLFHAASGKASRLDSTAAQVWKMCNHETSIDQAITTLAKDNSISEEAAEELLWAALGKLAKEGHLQNPEALPKGTSRREFLTRFATAAALFPVVASAMAPQPVHAASGFRCYNTGPDGATSCSNAGLTGAAIIQNCRRCGPSGAECPATSFCMSTYRTVINGSCDGSTTGGVTDTFNAGVFCLATDGATRQQSCAAARLVTIGGAGNVGTAAEAGHFYQCCTCPDPGAPDI
jgi:hypothetical protein